MIAVLPEVRLPALRLLWGAAWAEFLLVRLLSRVGIYIPKSGTALAVYRAAVTLGEIAFNFSLLLGAALLVLTLAGERGRGRGIAAVVAVAAALVLLAPGTAPPAGWSLAAAVVSALAVGLAGVQALRRADRELRPALGIVLATHLLTYGLTAAQLAWAMLALPGALPGAGPVLRGGELLAIAAPVALAVPLLGRRLGGAPGAIGLGAAAALGAAYRLGADLTAILAMYSLGFSLSWPPVIYLVALGLGLPALLGMLRRAPARGRALGLLFLAGYALQLNLQHLLVLTGWSLLALAPAAEEVSA